MRLTLCARFKNNKDPVTKAPIPVSRAYEDGGNTTDDDFAHSGVLYFVPVIRKGRVNGVNIDEENDLRLGRILSDKNINFLFRYTDNGDQDPASKGEQHLGVATVTAKDHATAVNSVFFGDRPLDNPGYSAFKLKGEVKAGSISNDLLDVYRVEQRLKYLGFPVFTKFSDTQNPRSPKEFVVDGTFSGDEDLALRGFYAATHYTTPAGSASASSGTKGMQTTVLSPSAKLVPIGASSPNNQADDNNLEWLNAYNAPHWINIYKFLGMEYDNNIPYGNFISNQNEKEVYATSWLGDWLRAWDASKDLQGLTTGKVQINGLTDPTLSLPNTHAKGGHSVGMSLDLGIGNFIDRDHQKSLYDQAAPANTDSGWSVANAKLFADELPNDRRPNGGPLNDQAGALRNFLSLYAVTQNDLGIDPATDHNGTWEELSVENGETVRNALFGSGEQNAQQLIQHVWIGDNTPGMNLNTYQAMRSVLNRLGFNGNGLSNQCH